MPRKVTIKNQALNVGADGREDQGDVATQGTKEVSPEVKAMMNVCDFVRDKVKIKRAKVENLGSFKSYFREILQQNHSKIEKYLKGTKYEKEAGQLKELENILDLGQQILNLRLCIRLSRNEDSKLLKWPKELVFKRGEMQFTKKSCFLSFTFEPDPRKRHIKLLFIIIGVLCIALYPIWPLQLRILVFKVSFYLLIGLVILSMIRYALFGLLWVCGIHFWIFPNLYADVGFIDSFKPLFSSAFSFEKGALAYLGRFAVIATYSFTIWYYLTYYDEFLNLRAGYSAGMQDIYDWGETKIAMKPTEPNLENFRRTRNWYDEMMDEWTKEDPPQQDTNEQKQQEQIEEPPTIEEEKLDKEPYEGEEEDDDEDEEEDEEDEEDTSQKGN